MLGTLDVRFGWSIAPPKMTLAFVLKMARCLHPLGARDFVVETPTNQSVSGKETTVWFRFHVLIIDVY